MTATNSWTPDDSQREILALGSGHHLVLAPPGCGKTQMLAERVAQAHHAGTDFSDMLCLTFTNRAARGMRERLLTRIGAAHDADSLFVGNVHRYCSKFLFDNGLVPSESAVIDSDDALSILARYFGEDEEQAKANGSRRKTYNDVINLSHLMHQIAQGYPRKLRTHTDCLSADDIGAMKEFCRWRDTPFTPEAMTDIYNHAVTYEDDLNDMSTDIGVGYNVANMLRKMKFAHAYEAYKDQNQLLDFEDLLLLAYDALSKPNNFKKYSWAQVDEVQDLNFLQLAIIDLLLTDSPTIVYLGDEQQAIFSFMGAKMEIMDELKNRCHGHIRHLGTNHRSPSYLLDVFNTYATDVMGIDPQLLAKSSNMAKATVGDLGIIASTTIEAEYEDVARHAAELVSSHPGETTSIVVNSNNDADNIGNVLTKLGIPHFKVSGTDLFSTDDIKLLLSHFSVIASDFNFIAWARLLCGFHLCATNASARSLVRQLRLRAMTPSDLLRSDGKSYVESFAETAQGDIVVFDTETTGLNVYEDDILQIAAMKMHNGTIVPGSEFSVYISTDRHIPEMLGDIPNPIIEERLHHELLSPAEALQRFLDYAGGAPLLGHNASYDYDIMDFNIRRYLPETDWRMCHPICFDSLKLAHLLFPGMSRYKLRDLITQLGLEGENSHLADADVYATCSLVTRCISKACEYVAGQHRFMQQGNMPHLAELFKQRYAEIYNDTTDKLHQHAEEGAKPILVSMMEQVWQQMLEEQFVKNNPKTTHLFSYLAEEMMHGEATATLKQLLDAHAIEMNTLRESDLCGASSMAERLFISTIHKAKGLEFDNVIVFDVIDGRFPNFHNANIKSLNEEDARKLYVAITRARKRLFISVSTTRLRYDGTTTALQPSRFLKPIAGKMQQL